MNKMTSAERERERDRGGMKELATNINKFSIQCKQIEINEARWAIKQSIFLSSLLPFMRRSENSRMQCYTIPCSCALRCILPILCAFIEHNMLNAEFARAMFTLQAGRRVQFRRAGRQAD